jgi:hypothetical protein
MCPGVSLCRVPGEGVEVSLLPVPCEGVEGVPDDMTQGCAPPSYVDKLLAPVLPAVAWSHR